MDNAEIRMKSSRFNEYVGRLNSEAFVIHNNLSGAMYEVPEYVHDALKENILGKISNADVLKLLGRGKFIVPQALDEEGDFVRFRDKVEAESRVIGLQILPTMSCNFECTYCYQNTRGGKNMARDTQDEVLNFVKQRVLPSTQSINCSYFGGDPLLNLEAVRYLSEGFLRIAQENALKYSALVITNGYLLTPKTVDVLLPLQARKYQITIDGPEHIHDQRRKLRNQKGTFNRIIHNLEYLLTQPNVAVGIRVNIDKSNAGHIEELLGFLDDNGILGKISLSFGVVSSFNQVCRGVEENVLTLEEANQAIKSGKIGEILKRSLNDCVRLLPQVVGCVATARNSFIIGPEGELYKCSKTIGEPDELCGHIENFDPGNGNFKKWIQFKIDMANAAQCRGCSMFPLCQGAICPYDYVTGKEAGYVCPRPEKHQGYLEGLEANYRRKIKST